LSVFNTPAPNLSKKEIQLIVQGNYKLSVDALNLTGERDQNFFLIDTSGNEYILKVFNSAEEVAVVEMQSQAMFHVAQLDSSIQVSSHVKTMDGSDILEYIHDNTAHMIRVVNNIPGRFLKDIDHSAVSLGALGAFMGKLDHALSGFHHPAAKREFPWDIRCIGFIETHLSELGDGHKKSLVDHFLNQYKQNILPNETQLRKAVIHNDGNDHNVLVNESGNTTAIIDFGDMVYTFIACEPAVCIAYMVLDKKDPFDAAAQVLDGYHQVFHLSRDELMAVIYLVCVRSCITVTMAAYRKKLFPDNDYISVSDRQAWEFLTYMQKEDLNDWAEKLLQYVNS